MTSQNLPPLTVEPSGLTRRRFVQWTAIAGAGTGLVSLAGCGTEDKNGAIVAPAG